jgi:hypothetical protein
MNFADLQDDIGTNWFGFRLHMNFCFDIERITIVGLLAIIKHFLLMI